MKKITKQFLDIFIRYGILILIAIPNLWIFYKVFAPFTIYPVYFLLNLFFDVSLSGNLINILGTVTSIEIIDACIAGSAYYLLLILTLSLQKVKVSKRLKMILIAFVTFLIVNILRVFFLSSVYILDYSWFDFAHKLFWYIGSVFLVILIWFAEVKYFKIKEVPFYLDLKFLYKKAIKK